MATVQTFSSKGKMVGYSQGSGPLAQVGKFDPTTGTVYTPARISLDAGLRSSGRVKITQPRAQAQVTARRTPSIGMGGALSARREF